MLVGSKHIRIFFVHVFHEAFHFQTFLKVIPGYGILSAEIWSGSQLPKERHVVGDVPDILEELLLHW
jgi:hypothetical protein